MQLHVSFLSDFFVTYKLNLSQFHCGLHIILNKNTHSYAKATLIFTASVYIIKQSFF